MEIIEIVVAVLASISLYKLRRRTRLWYGAIELVVGVIAMALAFYPQTGGVIVDRLPSVFGASIAKLMTLSAGVYIFVRGLDNIDVGKEKMSPSCRSLWERWI